jgi:hypothetical protein
MRRPQHPLAVHVEFLRRQAKQWKKLSARVERAELQAIARMIRREERKALRRQMARARKASQPKVKPKPRKKPGLPQILTEAAERRLEERYRLEPKRVRKEEFRLAAREARVSVKTLMHIRALLAVVQLRELITSGSLTLGRLGTLTLIESPERLRRVNVRGRIGREGTLGWVRSRRTMRAKFTAAASLKRAITVAENLEVIVPIYVIPRARRRVFPPERRNPQSNEARLERARSRARAVAEMKMHGKPVTADNQEP